MGRFATILLLVCASAFGQYTISTVAGNFTGTLLYYPTSVAVDSAGDVYVSDWSGLIRKIWVRQRAVTNFAGTGVLGFSGDGGQALNARIGRAISLGLDSAGNLFIADNDNNRIRRVDGSTGIITTVAGTGAARDSGDGGPAINAGVNIPTGVTVDSAGNLYFSSSWSRVRKVSAASSIIETIAGQTTTSYGGDDGPAVKALFWDPIPSLITRSGDLWITDFENSRVRVIDAATGVVTTVVGGAACGACFGGDRGPAKLAGLNYPASTAADLEGNVFIADTINHRIRRVDVNTGIIDTIGGTGVSGFSGDGGPATAAQISFPASVAVDRSGRVYFSDEGNQRIRVLTPTMSSSRRR